mmetsp:Transcript_7838/g.11829  ORF Transcript_7838/g.11829 Transcript_7838/m.11829 type:complete len:171 (+) Transcript_7838:39-551(+)
MSWSSALPAIISVNPIPLIITVFACTFIELLSNLTLWRAVKNTSQESNLTDGAAVLKLEIAKTNYPDKFVENAKLQRQLIKVEKELDRIRSSKSGSRQKVVKVFKWIRIIVYGTLIMVYWATTAIKFSPSFVAPMKTLTSLPFQGSSPGAISVAGVVLLFWLGCKGRLSS